VSETPPNTLQYRFDGPEDAPVLILGPSLGTTWHNVDRMGRVGSRRLGRNRSLRHAQPQHGRRAGTHWAPVWDVMRTLAEPHGPEHVRLVVWFD